MILRSVTKHVKDQNWFAVLIDFLIVVFGVFIGVQVNDWLDRNSEYKRESFYLEALSTDFNDIVKDIEFGISNYNKTAESMSLLVKQSRLSEPNVSDDELTDALSYLTSMQGTPLVSDTYLNLIGSGDLSIIKNQNIKKYLSSFFANAEVIQMVGNTHEIQLVNIFQPYIIENLDYASMIGMESGTETDEVNEPSYLLKVLKTQKFKNIIAVKWDMVIDLNGLLGNAFLDAQDIEVLLEKELQQRKIRNNTD